MRSNDKNTLIYGGIRPLFSTFSEINEPIGYSEITSAKSIGRFLAGIGLDELPAEIFGTVEWLVTEDLAGHGILMKEAYRKLAKHGQNTDAARTQMTYHLKKNFASVRLAVEDEYGYYLGDEFEGNKNFVHKLSIIYSVYVSED